MAVRVPRQTTGTFARRSLVTALVVPATVVPAAVARAAFALDCQIAGFGDGISGGNEGQGESDERR